MALKPCRECGAQVSTEADICPHCGVHSPTASNPLAVLGQSESSQKRTSKSGCLPAILVLIGLFVVVSIIGSVTEHQLTPEEIAQKQKQDAEFNVVFEALRSAGALAVVTGDAAKYDISGWNSSLDLYLPNTSTAKAEALSNYMCNRYFQDWTSSTGWKVRVFLINGQPAAECLIRRAIR